MQLTGSLFSTRSVLEAGSSSERRPDSSEAEGLLSSAGAWRVLQDGIYDKVTAFFKPTTHRVLYLPAGVSDIQAIF